MAAKNVTELYQALRPLILRELATAGGATAANGGMETHDLAGPYHTGTLLESQAPWAASKVEWQAALATHAALPDVHHAQAHVLATNAGLGADHTISGAAAGHVLRASSATAAAFAQLAHSDLSAIGTNTHPQIDTHIANSDIHVAHSGVSMSAGDGLTGGGTIAATRSFAVALSAVSGLELVGTSPNKTLQLADSVAGAGLASNNKVLSVGVANTGATGLTVEADAVRLTSSSNPGAAAAVLASDATGKLTLPLLVASSSVTTPLVTAGAGQSLTLQAPQDIIFSPGTNLAKLAAGKHLQSETFTSGFAGAGWRIEQGALTAAEVDNLTVRGTMRVYELLIQQIRATNGSVFVSSSAKLEAVTLVSGSTYDCTTDGSAADYQPFAVGDVLRAQRVNLGSGTLVWRSDLVVTAINVGGNARKFRATLQSATTAPAAGMEFVRLGNTSDVARQGAVYLTADDSGAPFIDVVAGIAAHADWNTAGKVKTRLGRLDGIFGQTDEFGLWAGTGVTAADRYIRASNSALELRNIPLALFDGSANTLLLSPGEGNRSPFLALGSPLPTAPITNDGVWLGLDEATTNYVQNPSFEVSTGTYWSYYSTPTVAQGGDALYGAYSLSMTTGAVADPYLYRQNSGAALASGQAWTFSAWVKAGNAGAVGKTVTIRLREQPGNLTSAVTIVLSAAWQRVTVTRTLTNATPTELNHYLQITSAADSGDVLLVDGVQLEQLAYATPYCDGSLGDGHTWSGTAHASASSRAGGYKLRVGTVANGVLQRGLLWDGANLVWKAANTSLDASGNLTASNATLSGQVTATTGAIGGWSIASTTLTGGNVLLDAAGKMRVGAASADRLWIDATHADYRLWVGDDTPGAAEFSVTKGGALSATGATISGAITATSGTVTGDFSVTSGGKLTAGGGGVLFDASGQAMGLYPNIDGAATPPDTAKAIAWYDTPSTRTGLQARQYVGKASDSTPHWNVTVNPGGSAPLTMTLWWGGSTLNELRFTNLALVFGLPALSLAGGLTPTAQVLSGSRLQLNSGSEFVSAAHLKAATANTYDLGEVGVKWRKLYVQEVVADTVSGGTALGGNTWQRPDAGDMYINSFSEAGNRTLYVANPGAGVMHLNVEGDIALGGLVDGVDLAAFKTAYDGHNHDGRYYTETELQTSGSASVHWGNVTNKPATFAPAAHALVGSDHTASGLTAGHVVRASGPTTFAWAQLAHSDLSGVGTNTHTQIDSHIAATAAHGVSGAIVGTTDTQTLSNKTLTTPTIASFANAPHAHTNAASGGTIAHGSLTGIGANDHHSQAHVLASTSGLGADHTVAGLTARQVLRATGATTAAFGAIEDADLPGTIVRTSRQIIAGNGLTGGGALSADVTVTMGTPGALSATSTDAVTATSHTHSIDSSIARSAITLTAGDGLTGGGNLTANRTLTLGTPGSITATSTNAVTSTSHTHAADSTLARSAITITAGAGLTGGGDLSANRTLDIGAGDGITAAADAISLALSAVSGLELTGTSPNKTLEIADSVAGAGLAVNNKVLSVGVSGLGLSVGADAVTLTSSSNPGGAASILASDASGYLQLVRLGVGTSPTERLDVAGSARVSGAFYQEKINTSSRAVGWFRFAQSVVDMANNASIFEIRWAKSSVHGHVRFSVGANYGWASGVSVNVLSHSTFTSSAISLVRAVTHATYTGNRMYVEAYNVSASTTFEVFKLSGYGWALIADTDGSIPSGYVTHEAIANELASFANQNARITIYRNGTIATTGDISVGGNATISGLSPSRLVASDGSDKLVSVSDLSSWIAGTANRVTVSSDGDGTVTLSAPQDIHTAATPTFGGLIAPWLRPASDSTTALQLRNASGAAILTVDTTNNRIGIGNTPAYKLDVSGDVRLTGTLYADGGIVDFGTDYFEEDGTYLQLKGAKPFTLNQTIRGASWNITTAGAATMTDVIAPSVRAGASTELVIGAGADIQLNPTGAVKLASGKLVRSSSFLTGFAGNGWQIDDGVITAGRISAEFDDLTIRGRVRVYELLVQQIRATNGSVFVTSTGKAKAVSGGPSSFTIETDSADNHGFLVGDLIRAQRFTGSGVYQSDLQVTAVANLYTFTATKIAGNDPASGMEFVRLGSTSDASRRGSVYLTADDSGAPFIDIVDGINAHSAWNSRTADAGVKTRIGRITGITGNANEYGIWAGTGTGNTAQSLVASSAGITLNNAPINFKAGSSTIVMQLSPGAGNASPYLAMGSTLPTAPLTGDGLWMGKDGSDYEFRVGTVSGGALSQGMHWDGSKLNIRGNLVLGPGMGYTVKDAWLYLPFDAPPSAPWQVNTTGHLGQPATVVGNVFGESGKFGGAVRLRPGGTNYISNPSFETDTSYWTIYAGATYERITTDAVYGSACASITVGGTSNPYLYRANLDGGPTLATGQTYTFSMYVKAGNAGAIGKNVTLYLQENASGSYQTTAVVAATSSWQRVSVTRTLTHAAPTSLNHYVSFTSSASSGDVFLLDAIQLEQTGYASPYIDSTMPNVVLSGTNHFQAADGCIIYNARQTVPLTGSLSMWVKPVNTGNNYVTFFRYSGAAGHVIVRARPSNSSWHGYWGATARASAASAVQWDTWQHVVVTGDGTTTTVYVNGVQVASGTSGTALSYHASNGAVIGYNVSVEAACGWIDDVFTTPNVLGADDVRAIYESGQPVYCPTSNFEFQLSDGTLANITANSTGIYAINANGDESFALANGATTWGTRYSGGNSLASGDMVLGDPDQFHFMYDASAASLLIGKTTEEHIAIDATSLALKYNTTAFASMTASDFVIGTVENIRITPTIVEFRNSAEVQGSLDGTTWTLGKTGTGENNVQITPTTLSLRSGGNKHAELTTAGVLTLGLVSSGDYLTVDATNGIRLYGNSSLLGQWTAAGGVVIGAVANSTSRIEITSGAVNIINRSAGGADTTTISLSSSGNASFTGAIDANSGTIGALTVDGALTVGTGGRISSGATAWGTGDGFWLEHNGGNPRVRIGTAAGNRLLFETATGVLTIVGNGSGITSISGSNITTGTLNASVVTVTNLNASNITTGTLSADRIGANSITAAKIAAGTITATEIAANTITGAKIAAGTITATQIAANTITGTQITGTTLSGIFADMGTLTAGSIVIGSTNKIWLNDSADGALALGGSVKGSAPFRVSAAGALTATEATVTGTITATSGSIAGALTIGTSGGIYQGTGTFASPTTGLKIWNSGGAGRIGGYSGGNLLWYSGSDGNLYTGGGAITFDNLGVSVSEWGSYTPPEKMGFRFYESGGYWAGLYGTTGSDRTVEILCNVDIEAASAWTAYHPSGNSYLKIGAATDSGVAESSIRAVYDVSLYSVITAYASSTERYITLESDLLNLKAVTKLEQNLTFKELSGTPTSPASGTEARVYMKSDKLIIQYNDGGTIRYKYLDLTGTGITWTHTTTAP